MSQQMVDHRCLPRSAQACPTCGEMLPPPAYCGTCGELLISAHQCAPRPLPHICQPTASAGRCMDCGQPLPAARFCVTCGEDVSPSHRCPAAPVTHVHRADPLHRCPAMTHQRCPDCGELLPALVFCTQCGMDITPAHTCQPEAVAHACAPHLLMPRRCSTCGETLPTLQHCTQCGADITPAHVCASS